MPSKYIPSEEELQTITQLYAQCKNYSEVSRQMQLSVATVKRILQENTDKINITAIETIEYDGEIPFEPKEKQIQNFNTEIEKFYMEILKNGGRI